MSTPGPAGLGCYPGQCQDFRIGAPLSSLSCRSRVMPRGVMFCPALRLSNYLPTSDGAWERAWLQAGSGSGTRLCPARSVDGAVLGTYACTLYVLVLLCISTRAVLVANTYGLSALAFRILSLGSWLMPFCVLLLGLLLLSSCRSRVLLDRLSMLLSSPVNMNETMLLYRGLDGGMI